MWHMTYNFCPNCGHKILDPAFPVHCNDCGKTYYQNAKPGASVLPIKNGRVLLAKRAIEPYRGTYDVIGGFMEANELPEAAALREAKEETGLNMRIISLLGAYVDRYGEDGEYTLNFHYITEFGEGEEPKAMDDIEKVEWFDIMNPPQDIRFQNVTDALQDLQHWYTAAMMAHKS